MSALKHTPVPWRVERDLDGTEDGGACGVETLVWSDERNDAPVCQVFDLGRAEQMANARLIAAAPRILGAVRCIAQGWHDLATARGICRAIVADLEKEDQL